MKDIAKKYEKKHVIECHNVPDIDMNKQDGGLPHMAGVYTYQVRRSCRADGDYTYNHAPMLTGFNAGCCYLISVVKRMSMGHRMRLYIQHQRMA